MELLFLIGILITIIILCWLPGIALIASVFAIFNTGQDNDSRMCLIVMVAAGIMLYGGLIIVFQVAFFLCHGLWVSVPISTLFTVHKASLWYDPMILVPCIHWEYYINPDGFYGIHRILTRVFDIIPYSVALLFSGCLIINLDQR